MFRSRTALHSFALWLALSAVLLRSLIPVGFMPGWTGSGGEQTSWLIICPASPLSAALASPIASHGHHDHAAMLAAMAAEAAAASGSPADPHAGHHAAMQHGMHHGADAMAAAGPPATAEVSVVSVPANGHAGHDPAEHLGHRIASEHQSCPFAGAVAPALPVAVAGYTALVAAATLDRPAATAAVVTASQTRLPPARGPPRIVDTLAA